MAAVVERPQVQMLPLEFDWAGLTAADAEVLRSAIVAGTAQAVRHRTQGIISEVEFTDRVEHLQRLARSLRAARAAFAAARRGRG